MLYGMGAALGWGLADLMVAVVARRIGSFVTVVLAHAAAFTLFTVLILAGVAHLRPLHPGLLVLPAIGVIGAIGYLAFYRALELGPIALASPIVAGYAAIVIGLSLTVLHEAVSGLELAGAGAAVTGVVLASADPRALRAGRAAGGPRTGVIYAVVAAVAFGSGAFLIGRFSQQDGWFTTVYLSRVGSAVALAAVLVARGRGSPARAPWRRRRTDDGSDGRVARREGGLVVGRQRRRGWPGPGLAAWAGLCGVLDVGGFASFARGSELGFVSITAAATVFYPLIPILFGVLHFRERPARSQWVGVAAVGAGLTLLALGN